MDSIKVVTSNVDISNFSNNYSWTNDTDTLGTQLTFDSIKNIADSAVVSLYFNGAEYFRGVVVDKDTKRWTYSYIVQDYSFYFKNGVVKQFNGMSVSDAIKSLASECYLIPDIVDIPTVINHIYVDEISNILDDLLDQAEKDQGVKYFKEIIANKLIVKKLSDMVITPKIILPKDITIRSSIEEMKNKITIVSGSDDNASIIATAEDTSQQWYYGVLSHTESVDETDSAKAQNIADNLLKEKNKIFKSTSFDVTGVKDAETIRANRMIYLHAGSRLNDFYKIKSAAHTLSKGVHKVNISLEW
ncbi:XkdQ/YqbQ family protein [Clostridium beijerinckii]|uniref:XkdQ/YqbQ family protein n=1 Tax=Clostridium beijerinckii TaxID=1520 RepID=UPI0013613332|nr:hypothetical protein [Clostridium beijerinckii]MZK51869.1 hypothetical protein [Clostridium beijerinckii]MZK61868.1 hypothetical protein [Clostridium beijerinckii]MZK70292.1 hypothetical protein [Clostridium beijerinckii]MZK77431.1 hypothetical protein [Clostridium beijerinckii]MZK85203.1 hypothetical protein [Clostridium beijerinckii]